MIRSRWSRTAASLWAILLSGIAAAPAFSAETVRVGGTGIALALMREAGDRLTAMHPDTHTDVLPSLGTSGGIKALLAGEIDVALSARALKPDEAKAAAEAYCMNTALIFASSRSNPGGVTRDQVPALYANPAATWPDGLPLKIILRARSGSENPYLVEMMPDMSAALAGAYKRPGMPVGSTDQENAELAQRIEGSFAVLSLLQLNTEKLKLTPLAFDGVNPSAQTLADKTYPMPMRICLLLPNQPSAGARRLVDFLATPEGRTLVRSAGAEPTS